MKNDKKISVIVPVFNEEHNIAPLVERIHKALSSSNFSYEIIFIDDKSSDQTRQAILAFSPKYPVFVFTKKGAKGKSYSIIEGVSAARYDTIVMIDADLQYPPEAIPNMIKKIDRKVGVVVAKRVETKTGFIRKIISWGFSFVFARLLHGFKHDVQSGLKVFKKEILERISLNPGPWSFDLEFLVKAKQAGYGITDEDIVFEKRQKEAPKISLIPASIEIGLSALKLKFAAAEIIPFHKNEKKKRGEGFHFKGAEFIHHASLPILESAFRSVTRYQKLLIFAIVAIFLMGLFTNWIITVQLFVALITVIYFADLLFNLFLILQSFVREPEIHVTKHELANLRDTDLPTYTILCPLYSEWQVLPQFVTAISRIDYPKNKLQVILLLEEDDEVTIAYAKNFKLPSYFEIVVVPHSYPKTKPKAMNYGLKYAKGTYLVVYDAEDIPDPNQLKKAVVAFKNSDEKTVCLQAKLNFYNPHHNTLTRIFTTEYSLWFGLVLTGLQSIVAPIPLGGTSNHFRRRQLKFLKGWDSFNVTEDCDLGMRLAKKGFKTALINSMTLEEANPDLSNWLNQRTRWIKGYIQTYLVHMRKPHEFIRFGGKKQLMAFQMVVGAKILSMFINPILWVTTIAYFAFRAQIGVFIEQFFPAPVLYMGVFSLVFGNFLYMYYYMVASAKRGNYELIKYTYLVPFYWLLMSLSAWKALIQLIQKPHFWPKTIHGYHFDSTKALNQATETIGRKLIDSRFTTYPVNLAPAYTRPSQKAAEQIFARTHVSSGSFLLGAMMIGNLLNFAFNAFLGRTISFVDFGLVTLINSFWYIVSVFVSALGATINHRTAFLTAKEGKAAAELFFLKTVKKVIKISLVGSILWVIFSPSIASFFNIPNSLPVVAFAPIILLAPLTAMYQGFLHGNFYFLLVALILLSTALLKMLSAVTFVALNLPSFTYLAIPISMVTAFFVASLIIKKRTKSIPSESKHPLPFPRRFYTGSVISGIATSAFLTLDVMLVKHFLPPVEAGQYAFLALVGKMIYYFGSLLNVFMTPFVSRDIGAKKDPNNSFYRLLIGTISLTVFMYVLIGVLGDRLIPLLFGAKAYPILQYLPKYSLAIGTYVIVNSIISFHLIRHHYSFPVSAIGMSLILSAGIALFHSGISQIVDIMLITSTMSLVLMVVLHLLQKNGKFLVRNIVDLIGLFLPLPKSLTPVSGKRILVFNWRDMKHRYAGGAEVYIHELSKRWVRAGNTVTVFCGNDGFSPREEMVDGIQIIRRGGFYFVYIWALLYYLFRFRKQYDVIIDSENGIPFFTPLYTQERKFLLIHHVHQNVFRRSLIPPLAWFASFLEMRLMPFVYKNIQTITVSPSSKKEIMEKELSSVEPVIIYNGVDLAKFKPGEKNEHPLVLYLGRLKYYKSINIFIRSAYEVLKKVPNAIFVIAGDGEQRPGLELLARKLGIVDNISFLGKVTEEEKVRLYQKAWVFVNPSMMEGWGITTIEANACGTPVVASDVPGLRDSVKNPHSGILIRYGYINGFAQSITRLLKNENLRTQLALGAILWAQNFDWEKSAEKSLGIIL